MLHLSFWAFPRLDLEQVAEQLGAEFMLSKPDFDSENLYEWFYADSADGLSFGVYRTHCGGAPDFAAPLRVCISPLSRDTSGLGRRLATSLGTTVFFGVVAYLEGDDYSFTEQTRYEPDA